MRSTRADNAEKSGSIRAPPALPRLVNILHAVDADRRVLRQVATVPFFFPIADCRCRDYPQTREDEKAAPACIDRIYPIIYSPARGTTQAKTLSQMRNLYSR